MENTPDNARNTKQNVQVKKKKKQRDIINNSGQGNVPVVKVVSDKFNWGAFLLTWIWGIAHKKYITLIIIPASFIPIISIILPFWFGYKGNTWAWQNKRYRSIKEFHEGQKKWAIAGTIVSTISTLIVVFIFINSFLEMNLY